MTIRRIKLFIKAAELLDSAGRWCEESEESMVMAHMEDSMKKIVCTIWIISAMAFIVLLALSGCISARSCRKNDE